MTIYEQLYANKENENFIQEQLNDFLLYQIYSPKVIKAMHCVWPNTEKYLRENTPTEIQNLIQQSESLSEGHIQEKLNQFWINKAVYVLENAQSLLLPLTQDVAIPQTKQNLLSSKGQNALGILKNAVSQHHYTNQIADLAIRSGHKFLFDSSYFKDFSISKETANALLKVEFNQHKSPYLNFPILQLTKGCSRHCSHCCSRAEAHLSHMPWMMFTSLHRGLNKYYKNYPMTEAYFSEFYSDSDLLEYYDPIVGTDAGDAALWTMQQPSGMCFFTTNGVTDEASKTALAKAVKSGAPVILSFIETSLENMGYNLQKLDETLGILENMKAQNQTCILHFHPRNGSSISKSFFRNFSVREMGIWAYGRAKDLPSNETEYHPESEFISANVIRPSGEICFSKAENGEYIERVVGSIFGTIPKSPSYLLKKILKSR